MHFAGTFDAFSALQAPLPPEGDAVVCGPPAFNDAVLGFLAGTRLRTTELLSY